MAAQSTGWFGADPVVPAVVFTEPLPPGAVVEPNVVVPSVVVVTPLAVPNPPPNPLVLVTPLLAALAFPVVPTLDVEGAVVPDPDGPPDVAPASPPSTSGSA